MRAYAYHDGQRAVQREANSVACADKLSTWVGPVSEYANEADLIVIACNSAAALDVAVLSGPPPLVSATHHDGNIAVLLPLSLATHLPVNAVWGGIVINPATARRSRIAGQPEVSGDHIQLPCSTAFTNCRKYMTPTSSTGRTLHIGPNAQRDSANDDPWIVSTLAQCETAFLVTTSPDNVADVSHRGGQPGFLRYDASRGAIAWTEYLGDGMFVSTGNLRQQSRFALLALDYASGDAVRVDGVAQYHNVRRDRHERVDALLQATEPFPVQGSIEGTVTRVSRLVALCHPRVRVERRSRITSADTTAEQHPQ